MKSWKMLVKKVQKLPMSQGEHSIPVGLVHSGAHTGAEVRLWKDQADNGLVQMKIEGYGFAGYIPPEVWVIDRPEYGTSKKIVLLTSLDPFIPTTGPEFSMDIDHKEVSFQQKWEGWDGAYSILGAFLWK